MARYNHLARWINKPPLGVPPDLSHPDAQGLVLELPFNEGAGGMVYDGSGHGNHGTLINFAFPPTATSGWGPGKFGKTLVSEGWDWQVGGIASEVNIPDPGTNWELDFTNKKGMTLSVWIFPYAVTGGTSDLNTYNIMSKASAGSRPYWLVMFRSAFTFRVEGTGGATSLPTSNFLVAKRWYHVVATWQAGGEMSIYANGVLRAQTISIVTALQQVDKPVKIGGLAQGGKHVPFDGIIGPVRIHNIALPPEQVMDQYLDYWAMYEQPATLYAGTKFFLYPTDNIIITDNVAKTISLPKSDDIIIGDSPVKTIGLAKADNVIITDSPVKTINLPKADNVIISDDVVKDTLLVKAENIILAESPSKLVALAKAEALPITDSVVKDVALAKADTLNIADSIQTLYWRARALKFAMKKPDFNFTMEKPSLKYSMKKPAIDREMRV